MHSKRSYRLRLPIKIRVSGQDKTGAEFETQCATVNVSHDGACIICDHSVPPGSTVKVSVGSQIRGTAVVVWSEGGRSALEHRIGLKFLEMSEWIVK